MYDGILAIDKPCGFTSHDAVAKLRRVLGQKKIGHAGTLDPLATGVLVILLGNAAKASDFAAQGLKRYVAVLRLGVKTDTQDVTGKVLEIKTPAVTERDLEDALARFRGSIKQIPPMYSALSVGGKRLYDLAREGIEIERAARDVEIKELRLLEKLSDTDYKIEVLCSKGTYIRTLCSDVGDALSCGGCMSELRRTAVGVFTEKEAMSLEEVERLHAEGRLSERIAPADALFRDLPAVVLNDFGEKRAKNGAFLEKEALKSGELPPEGELCRVYAQNGDFLMLAVTKKLDRGPDAAFCYRTFKTQG